jgi:hypothetical protein
VVFHWRRFIGTSLARRTILAGRLSRSGSEGLFQVIGKAAIAQVQVGSPAQAEFVICDQSIDTNHGFAKVKVENSEVAKIRVVVERKLTQAQRVAEGARERMTQTQECSRQVDKQAKAQRAKLAQLGTAGHRLVAQQQVAEAELAKSQQRKQRAEETCRAAFDTCERACCQQRTLLRE